MTAGPTDAASHEGQGSKGHLAELEGWRALAALGVLLTHVGFLSGATGRHILPGFLARADIGVAIFFVLSGFLLYRPWARRSLVNGPPIDSRSYAVRRFARLVPAWLLVLVGTLLLVPESRDAGATPWIANLLQVQSLRLGVGPPRIGPTLELVDRGDVLPCAAAAGHAAGADRLRTLGGGTCCCSWASPPRAGSSGYSWAWTPFQPAMPGTEPFPPPSTGSSSGWPSPSSRPTLTSGIAPVAG